MSSCRATNGKGAEHPREAHYDAALARVEAENADARGDHNQAKAWRWVAANIERRAES